MTDNPFSSVDSNPLPDDATADEKAASVPVPVGGKPTEVDKLDTKKSDEGKPAVNDRAPVSDNGNIIVMAGSCVATIATATTGFFGLFHGALGSFAPPLDAYSGTTLSTSLAQTAVMITLIVIYAIIVCLFPVRTKNDNPVPAKRGPSVEGVILSAGLTFVVLSVVLGNIYSANRIHLVYRFCAPAQELIAGLQRLPLSPPNMGCAGPTYDDNARFVVCMGVNPGCGGSISNPKDLVLWSSQSIEDARMLLLRQYVGFAAALAAACFTLAESIRRALFNAASSGKRQSGHGAKVGSVAIFLLLILAPEIGAKAQTLTEEQARVTNLIKTALADFQRGDSNAVQAHFDQSSSGSLAATSILAGSALRYSRITFSTPEIADWHVQNGTYACLVAFRTIGLGKMAAGGTDITWSLVRVVARRRLQGDWIITAWSDIAQLPNDPVIIALNGLASFQTNPQSLTDATVDNLLLSVPRIAWSAMAERMADAAVARGNPNAQAEALIGITLAKKSGDVSTIAEASLACAQTFEPQLFLSTLDKKKTFALLKSTIQNGLDALRSGDPLGFRPLLYQEAANIAASGGDMPHAVVMLNSGLTSLVPNVNSPALKARILFQKALALFVIGEADEAQQTIKLYAQIEQSLSLPKDPSISANLSFLRGIALIAGGKLKEGKYSVSAALLAPVVDRDRSVKNRMRMMLVWSLMDAGDINSALMELEQCRKDAINDPGGVQLVEQTTTLLLSLNHDLDNLYFPDPHVQVGAGGRINFMGSEVSPAQKFNLSLESRLLDTMTDENNMETKRALRGASPNVVPSDNLSRISIAAKSFPIGAESAPDSPLLNGDPMNAIADSTQLSIADGLVDRDGVDGQNWFSNGGRLDKAAAWARGLALIGRHGDAIRVADSMIDYATHFGSDRLTRQSYLDAADSFLIHDASSLRAAERYLAEAEKRHGNFSSDLEILRIRSIIAEYRGQNNAAIALRRAQVAKVLLLRNEAGETGLRSGFLERAYEPTFALCRLLTAANRASDVWDAIEALRGRTLAEQIRDPHQPVHEQQLDKFQKDRLAEYDKRISDIPAEIERRDSQKQQTGDSLQPDADLFNLRILRERYLQAIRSQKSRRQSSADISLVRPAAMQPVLAGIVHRLWLSILPGNPHSTDANVAVALVARSDPKVSGGVVVVTRLLKLPDDWRAQIGFLNLLCSTRDLTDLSSLDKEEADEIRAGLNPGLNPANVDDASLNPAHLDPDQIQRGKDRLPPTGKRDWHLYARSLYRILLAPFSDCLATLPKDGSGEIMLSIDGPLNNVPFAALLNEKDNVLIQQYALSFVPSATVLRLLRRSADNLIRPSLKSNPLIAAITTFGSGFASLPGASVAAEQVQREFARVRAAPAPDHYLLQSKAEIEQIRSRMPSASVIHFSTHGLVERPSSYSALLFKDANGRNARLQADEIQRTRINARLVYLAACDTAEGINKPGEGVVGLSWSFLAAGSVSNIVTLWAIQDGSAPASVARQFYNQLLDPDRPPSRTSAACLAHAIRSTADAFPHPYYWACYILTGDAR